MTLEKSGYDADDKKKIKKLILPDGFRVGVINLDNIFKEVDRLKLTDADTIKKELLARVKSSNYVVPGAEEDYSTALFREYQRKFGEPGKINEEKPEIHTHTKG